MANDNNAARPTPAVAKPEAGSQPSLAAPITSYRVQAILSLFR